MVSILDGTQGASEGPTSNSQKNQSKATETQTPRKTPTIPNCNKDVPAKSGAQKDEKLSGAELKKMAKAEKAAKRAQSKQEQPAPPKDATKNAKPENRSQRDTISPSPQQVPPKGQHNRTASASMTSQKPLQLRPGQPQAATVKNEARKGVEKLAFVSHLHGIPEEHR